MTFFKRQFLRSRISIRANLYFEKFLKEYFYENLSELWSIYLLHRDTAQKIKFPIRNFECSQVLPDVIFKWSLILTEMSQQIFNLTYH